MVCSVRYQQKILRNGKWAGISPAHSFSLPAITVSAAAAAAFPARLVDGFVYTKLAAFEFVAVGAGYCGSGFFISAHFDESEAFGVTGFTIEDDLGGGYITEPGEQIAEPVFGGVVGKVTYVQFLGH